MTEKKLNLASTKRKNLPEKEKWLTVWPEVNFLKSFRMSDHRLFCANLIWKRPMVPKLGV
ncbi:MAG: hypothetical protein KBF76_08375 [Verrucomicrobiales bacterium]|nr:hypothetical protein [Verrucomicrobiales bacterium]